MFIFDKLPLAFLNLYGITLLPTDWNHWLVLRLGQARWILGSSSVLFASYSALGSLSHSSYTADVDLDVLPTIHKDSCAILSAATFDC